MSAPTPLGDLFAAAMSRADGCAGCDNTEPPRAAVPIDGGWMTSYRCSDCSASWTRVWDDHRHEWRPVVGYEGAYEVSSAGDVHSVDRVVTDSRGRHRAFPGRVLKPRVHVHGYLTVSLVRQGEQRTVLVHGLVAEAFLGPRPTGLQVAHRDGDPANNEVWNLRYDTRSGNQMDRVAHGTSNRGERHGRHKLTAAQVRAIRAQSVAGTTQRALAAEYGVSQSCIYLITAGRTWAWLTDNINEEIL